MELELQTSRRRPSTAEAVMEGAESEDGQARSVLSQEVLMDDVDSTLGEFISHLRPTPLSYG